MAKDKGVDVAIVTSPKWPCSIAAGSDDLKLFAFLESLADEQQVPYIKIISEDYPQFKDSSLYVDSAHLNGEGAKIFSRILTSRLIKEFSDSSAQSDYSN